MLCACSLAIWQLSGLLVGLVDIFQKQVGRVDNSYGLESVCWAQRLSSAIYQICGHE